MQAISEIKAESSSATEPLLTSPARSVALFTRPTILCGLAIAFAFALLLCYWHSLDNRQPSMDEAGHILCAFSYADLFSHPHVARLSWWGKLLTVNNFYPPAVYVFNGMLKILLGPQHYVDWLSLAFYDIVLTMSVFCTTLLLTGRRLAAAVSAVSINLYAEMIFLSHTFLLDFQVSAMIAFGVFFLVFWHEKPSWKRALLGGIALALVLCTKQIAGAFLAGPALFYFVSILKRRAPGWKVEVAQLFSIGLIAALFMVPWAVASVGFISEFAESNKKVISSTRGVVTVPQALVRGVRYYTFALSGMITPMLLTCAGASLVFLKGRWQLRLLPVLLSGVVGALMISLLPWQYPQHRYIAGAMLAPAVYTGTFFAQLWDLKLPRLAFLPKAALSIVSVLALLQFFSMNFFPYPFSQPQFMCNLSQNLGVKESEMNVAEGTKSNPHPYEDWGQCWVLETIGKRDPKAPVWLNVMANHVEFNPHTFTLQARYMGSAVKPTSSRTWTVLGDTVNFSKETAMYYQWYLIKSGDIGTKKGSRFLLNAESEKAFENLLQFVKESGKFELIAKRKVPDGSEIELYRQK